MNNNQCESYGVLALKNILARRGISDGESQDVIEEFCEEINYLFDRKTEEEVEEQAKRVWR